MNDPQDKRAFSMLLDGVMPIYRLEASVATKRLWWGLLREYDITDVEKAFEAHLRVNGKTITPADITRQLEVIRPDGRPGADEAWAMIPQDEYGSVVMSNEMSEAWGIAQNMLPDKNAARMAFRDAYNRIVATNKLAGRKPEWFPSLGFDVQGRTTALADAIRNKRLAADHALKLVAPEKQAEMLSLAGITEKLLLAKPNPEGIKRIRDAVAGLDHGKA